MKNNVLVIAASSASGYAKSAVSAGYNVITLDFFADTDTRQCAQQAYTLKLSDGVLDVDDFKRQFQTINFEDCLGFLYGSIFDHIPELLDWVSTYLTILGNSSAVLARAKAFDFFELLDTLNIQHPDVVRCEQCSFDQLENPNNWLVKSIGGIGGMHVKPAIESTDASQYYQIMVDGTPVSLLFIADGSKAHHVGINQQFISPTQSFPFRFAGAVNHYSLPFIFEEQFKVAAQQLTQHLGLKGSCSLDAIYDGKKLWIIELNPRLSATFQLYPSLMHTHLAACFGGDVNLPTLSKPCAQLILYADRGLKISSDFDWPESVADRPFIGKDESAVFIEQGAPICTIYATALSAIEASKMAQDMALKLHKKLLSIQQ